MNPVSINRLLSQRIAWLTAVSVFIFVLLAIAQAVKNVGDESAASDQLQLLSAGLSQLANVPNLPEGKIDAAIEQIHQLAQSSQLRHVNFELRDAAGLLRAQSTNARSAAEQNIASRLLELVGKGRSVSKPVAWQVRTTDGRIWNLQLQSNPLSEQNEAGHTLSGIVLTMLALAATLGVGVTIALKKGLKPIQAAVQALRQLSARSTSDVLPHITLPTSPISEVDQVNQSVNELALSLQALEQTRRNLSIKLLSSQEQERVNLARNLHDELGQKLVIIRINGQYLSQIKTLAPEQNAALADIEQAAQSVQTDIRAMLKRLLPYGSPSAQATLTVDDFEKMLNELVGGWRERMQGRCTYSLTVDARALETMGFNSNRLLSLYRMTQEALTNAAKHSHATQVGVALTQSQENRVAGTGLRWQVCDNGVGISDFNSACKRGSGLDGIRERAWALGGDLQLESATTLELSEKGTVFFAEFLEF